MNRFRIKQMITASVIVGGTLLLGFAAIGIVLLTIPDKHSGHVLVNRVIFEIVVLPGLLSLAWRIRRRFLPPWPRALKEDGRPPILYLRPFTEDKKKLSFSRPYTYEETLVSVLDDAGPVVAIGRPGERLPPLGAIRVYVEAADDEAWRTEVRNRISTARLVVIQAGTSASLLWELRAVLERAAPDRIVLSFLTWRPEPSAQREKRYQAFLAASQGLFPQKLPRTLGRAGFLTFAQDWSVVPIDVRTLPWFLVGQESLNAEGLRGVLYAPLKRRDLRIHKGPLVIGATLLPALYLMVFLAAAYTAWDYLSGAHRRREVEEATFARRIDSLLTSLRRMDSLSQESGPHGAPKNAYVIHK
jgi:hypothetical protein